MKEIAKYNCFLLLAALVLTLVIGYPISLTARDDDFSRRKVKLRIVNEMKPLGNLYKQIAYVICGVPPIEVKVTPSKPGEEDVLTLAIVPGLKDSQGNPVVHEYDLGKIINPEPYSLKRIYVASSTYPGQPPEYPDQCRELHQILKISQNKIEELGPQILDGCYHCVAKVDTKRGDVIIIDLTFTN